MSSRLDSRDGVILHPAGVPATLITDSGEAVPVQSYEGPDEVVLIVLSDLADPPPSPHSATLQYSSLRGIVRMHGEAVFSDRSLVRFRAAGDPEVLQRRSFVRVPSSEPIALHPAPAPRGAHPTRTIDVSGGGMLLFGAEQLELHAQVRFEMDIDDGAGPVTGLARVVRIDENGRRGLAFEQIAEPDRQRLIRRVFARMRDARAKTRGDLV